LLSTGIRGESPLTNNAAGTRRHISGFTLLEVVVALAIIVLAFGAIYQTLGIGTRSLGETEEIAYATLLAESEMASLGIERPLRESTSAKTTSDGYLVRTEVKSIEPSEGAAPTRSSYKIYDVTLTIEWGEGTPPRSVSFRTFRIAESK